MTTPRKPKAAPKRQDYPSSGRTAAGQRIKDAPDRKSKYSDDLIAAARALWEGNPKMSLAEVAQHVKVPYAMVSRWSKGGKDGTGERWVKRKEDMTALAQEAADKYVSNLREYGEEITTEQKGQAVLDTVDEVAVDLRAKLIDKHRKDWNVVRTLMSEALTGRKENHKDAFEKAKLAKITAEAMKIAQDSERRAWGIDTGPDTKVQVVIERE